MREKEAGTWKCFSSLYIGILAATWERLAVFFSAFCVSVPFTSGSSLQPSVFPFLLGQDFTFQFPLHRDPRCNYEPSDFDLRQCKVSVPFTSGSSLQRGRCTGKIRKVPVSVPFTSGSSLQQFLRLLFYQSFPFQFPLHRDPRCNRPFFTIPYFPVLVLYHEY